MSATAAVRPATAAIPPQGGLRLSRAVPCPERNVRPRGLVEGALHGVVTLLPWPPAIVARVGARRIAWMAAAHEAESVRLAAEPAESAATLRRSLRSGITPKLTARSFALIRAVAADRLGMRPHDVQLMAAWTMLRGRMAELATGEGKTLAASLAVATAALAGRMVHVVTVNDYLAERDHAQLSPLYRALGLSAGLIVHGMTPDERRSAYACDIVYASNKELVFDYLRDQILRRSIQSPLHGRLARLDNRHARQDGLVLRGLDFAVVDEADSVLVDEARTPLIISEAGDSDTDTAVCTEALNLVADLTEGSDYSVNRSERRIDLTDPGRRHIQALSASLGERWGSSVTRSELVVKALTARLLFERDVHYLVRDGKVCIIDEYTGRLMPDRFWNDGLHQMIETKEGCEPTGSRGSVARITYQRFFGRYHHLCGMSGTLAEVGGELRSVYGTGVTRIPTHNRCRRTIEKTRIVATAADKWRTIADRAVELARTERPVLIGTRSVADSDRASHLLDGHGVTHALLNAAQDSVEAAVVACAGEPGRVTIATNMAGRGTDIRLADGVSDRGGLAVILSDRHDAVRVDRQLAGRGARQGDAGSFAQILSLEDALLDPLRTRAVGRMLLRLAGTHRIVALGVFALMQKRAERRHRLIRRELMRFEERLQSSLSFAGRPD
jgi:preprotein translocase subunit SecA